MWDKLLGFSFVLVICSLCLLGFGTWVMSIMSRSKTDKSESDPADSHNKSVMRVLNTLVTVAILFFTIMLLGGFFHVAT
jgi:heme/copper-type cytochrome/quinol oxidase subunit 2